MLVHSHKNLFLSTTPGPHFIHCLKSVTKNCSKIKCERKDTLPCTLLRKNVLTYDTIFLFKLCN